MKLSAAARAAIRDAATRYGIRDPEALRAKVSPAMSPECWAGLMIELDRR